MKVALIICYYGELPACFDVWVRTAGYNKRFDFLIVTDLEYRGTLPENIHFIKMGFGELKDRIEQKMGFTISLEHPYKLCDFKPAYGLIFENELEGYDYFGNFDVDLAFGDLSKFVTDDILRKYEKLFHLGHFTLYKNNDKMRTLFMSEGAIWDYKTAYQSHGLFAIGFDEMMGMLPICRANKVNCYFGNDYADISIKHKKTMRVYNHTNYDVQVFYWEDGKAMRAYIDAGNVFSDEFMYIHWQKKHPISRVENIEKCTSFYIFPDKIVPKERKGTPSEKEIRSMGASVGLIEGIKECFLFYSGKIVAIVKMDKKERTVRMLQLRNRKIRKSIRREMYG